MQSCVLKTAACLLCTTLLSPYLNSSHPPSVVATTPPRGQLFHQHPRREGAAPRGLEPALWQCSHCRHRHSVQRRGCSQGLHQHHGPCSPGCLLALRSESWLWRPLLIGGGSPNPVCPPCGCQQPGEAPLVSFLSSAAHLSFFSQLPLAWKEKHHHLPDSLSYKG